MESCGPMRALEAWLAWGIGTERQHRPAEQLAALPRAQPTPRAMLTRVEGRGGKAPGVSVVNELVPPAEQSQPWGKGVLKLKLA